MLKVLHEMGLFLSYSAWIFLPCACVELLISPPGKQKVVVNYMTGTSDTTNTLICIHTIPCSRINLFGTYYDITTDQSGTKFHMILVNELITNKC
jgi:hypothetical protein